jgi:hypothetical protein
MLAENKTNGGHSISSVIAPASRSRLSQIDVPKEVDAPLVWLLRSFFKITRK